jgi:hypothetical protein
MSKYQFTESRSRPLTIALAAAAGSALLAGSAGADIGSLRLTDALSQPLYVTQAPGDNARLFICEKTGDIRVFDLDSRKLDPAVFLTISDLSTSSEQGLLGLAFHPDFATNNRFYVNHTDMTGDTVIVQYSVDPATGDVVPASDDVILRIEQPQANHNGGWIGFGPDGFLYIATGDGGGANDNDVGHTPGIGNSQDTTDNLLGKVLRIDVDGDDFPMDMDRDYAIPPSNPFVGVTGDGEIWAYGLRNPFRASFDRLTGDLWIGDVGQNSREEINFQQSGFAGGANYGWRLREGLIATPTGGVGGPRPADNVDPLYDYEHGFGPFQGRSVTGGYVFRGIGDDLQGLYLFADFISDNIWTLERSAHSVSVDVVNITADLVPFEGSLTSITSFGEDNQGNLYITTIGGSVFRIVDSTCPGDANFSNSIDAQDLIIVLANFGATHAIGPTHGDVDGSLDRNVNGADLTSVLGAFGEVCP